MAFRIVAGTAADHLAERDPELALRWSSGHSRALGVLAARELNEPVTGEKIDKAVELARSALVSDPLNADALLVLGSAAQLRGDQAHSAEIMEIAAERSLRDINTLKWRLQTALNGGDAEAALRTVDALFRARPSTKDELLPLLAQFATHEDSIDSLVDLVSQRPPWRGWLLEQLPRSVAEARMLYPFFSRLGRTSARPSTGEARAFVERLAGQGEYQLGYVAWVESLSDDRYPILGNVTNGGFDYPNLPSPFEWRFDSVHGATAAIETMEGVGPVLRTVFFGNRVPFRHVSQMVLLPPGPYHFSARVKLQSLMNDRGLQWTLRCSGGENRLLGQTERLSGTSDWRTVSMDLQVPDSGDCRAQTLQLRLAARVPAEEEISGEALFDDLTIVRVGTEGS